MAAPKAYSHFDFCSGFESKVRSARGFCDVYLTTMTMQKSDKIRDSAAGGRVEPRTASAARWAAVEARDPRFDGEFFYSVQTTGVYCRPSCPSRRAKREHVTFHATCARAEALGFRPCKRCKPNQPSLESQYAQTVASACRLIETAEQPLSLRELARHANLSPYHFHRIFKSILGVTPKAYAVAHRRRRVRATLASGATVTSAIHEAGFNSSSRFYAGASDTLGMTPSDFRQGGAKAEIKFAVGACSLGAVLAAASDKGVCAILLGDDPEALVHDLEDCFPNAMLIGGDDRFETVVAKIVALIEMPQRRFDLPLDIRGTAFQHRVWDALRQIPPGQTVSYREIAARIGAAGAVRAVAGACGANKIAVAIPCHRVVRTDGSISGYRWGVERKRQLLALEARGAHPAKPRDRPAAKRSRAANRQNSR